jgi:hypothetical protein
VADPSMSYAGSTSDLLHDALRPESAQEVGSAGLAHIHAVHYVPDGENRVSKQEVNDQVCPASAPKARSVALAQIRKLLGSLNRVIGLDGDTVQEELEPLGDLAALSDVLQPVVVVALALIEVAGEIQQRCRQPPAVREVEHDEEPPEPPVAVEERVNGLELVMQQGTPYEQRQAWRLIWLVRNSPGVLSWPLTPVRRISCISLISRSDIGNWSSFSRRTPCWRAAT